jgi:hypothetical protein
MAVRATLGQPPVFAGLLGGRGTYTVTPADPWHVWGGYYETGSLIWRSRWAGSSRTECREALALPADPHRVVILRRIEAVDGPARVKVVLDVRARSGRSQMTGRPGAAQGPPGGHGHRQAARWSALADSILASLGDSVHATGRWQRSPEDARIDAALLLPMIRGTLPADDPRIRATVRAVQDELTEDGYVYRFRHDARPLHKSEGAFLLGGFLDGAGRARVRRRRRGGALVRAQPVRRAARRACTPRNTTFTSASCAATCPRPSCTPGCWSARPACRPRPQDRGCWAKKGGMTFNVVVNCATGGTVAGAGRLAVCFFAGLWFALPLDRRGPVPANELRKPDCPACRG